MPSDVLYRFAWLLAAFVLAGCPVDNRTLLGDDEASDDAGASGAGFAGMGGGGSSAPTDGGSGTAGEAGSPSDAGSGGMGTSGSAGNGGNGGAGMGGAAGATVCPDLDGNGVPDCQESIVQNPSFDAGADLSHWVSDVNVTQSWDAKDAESRAQSGSLGVQNTTSADLVGLTMGGSRQCVPAAAGKSYAFYVNVFVPGDQGSAGAGGVNMSFYASSDCTGAALYGKTSNLPELLDSWSLAQMDSVAPSYTQSMSVRLVSVKSFDAQPLTVLFDDVLVKEQPPSTGP